MDALPGLVTYLACAFALFMVTLTGTTAPVRLARGHCGRNPEFREKIGSGQASRLAFFVAKLTP